jgi:probable F420-dependent oxidoreductase
MIPLVPQNFRFGVSAGLPESRSVWVDKARFAEALGFDVLLLPDHLGHLDPFTPLAVAAQVTDRLRVGTLVLINDFHNAALLVRQVATVDLLTEGRLELGLGLGHRRWEYEAAGVAFGPLSDRLKRLEATIALVKEKLWDRPHLRLLLGGASNGVLALAASEANIVGFAGLRQRPGAGPGTFDLETPEATDERVAYLRQLAGERIEELELNALVQLVEVTDDRRGAAERIIAERLPSWTPQQVLDSPFLLLGTADEIAQELLDRRERSGFSYYVVFEPAMEAFSEVVARLKES